MPGAQARGSVYEGAEAIFDHFKIEPQIVHALERKVWLKSGGYLVFDQAEALTAIDVNTGCAISAGLLSSISSTWRAKPTANASARRFIRRSSATRPGPARSRFPS